MCANYLRANYWENTTYSISFSKETVCDLHSYSWQLKNVKFYSHLTLKKKKALWECTSFGLRITIKEPPPPRIYGTLGLYQFSTQDHNQRIPPLPPPKKKIKGIRDCTGFGFRITIEEPILRPHEPIAETMLYIGRLQSHFQRLTKR